MSTHSDISTSVSNIIYSHFKDEILDRLSSVANVAQFVSFGQEGKQRFSRVHGYPPNTDFGSIESAAKSLLDASIDKSVNIRSYTPENPKSREFIYGLQNVEDVVAAARRLMALGFYTIINETVDVNDGGVSGVALGSIIEFAPGDTPRCVEKPGTVTFERSAGLKLLEIVYGFNPNLTYPTTQRIEFSIHPLRRGYRHEHTIIWELEEVGETELQAAIEWPNIFSKLIGDKAFGLLVAYIFDLKVPFTRVIPRSVAPFSFGQTTSTGEIWIRTCPFEPVPGYFTTQRGWLDPFKLMSREDPDGKMIASILAQEGVDAIFSGALVTNEQGDITIEGVQGFGDDFMLGRANKEDLPEKVVKSVQQLYQMAFDKLGQVRMEWVCDEKQVWIVQLHKGSTTTSGNIIFPGDARYFHRFEVERGIDELRHLVSVVKDTNDGIILVGNIGVTSHLGDILRKARIPSRRERS